MLYDIIYIPPIKLYNIGTVYKMVSFYWAGQLERTVEIKPCINKFDSFYENIKIVPWYYIVIENYYISDHKV